LELNVFKISGFPMVAGTIVCALQTATGPPASALDRRVELTNNTRIAIVEIYISHVGAEFWNIDLLGDDFLAPASSVMVNIDDRAGCRFDVKTVFDDGTTQVRRDADICAAQRYAISSR
jgi:serine protease Do